MIIHHMAIVIAVANLKGGCGKSTIAVNLACELTSGRNSVALVDADAQGTATYWCSQGDLPVQHIALPLDGQRNVQRWVSQVLGLDCDYVVVDAPPHVGASTEAAVGIADL